VSILDDKLSLWIAEGAPSLKGSTDNEGDSILETNNIKIDNPQFLSAVMDQLIDDGFIETLEDHKRIKNIVEIKIKETLEEE
jgi:hypothetical protein